MKSQYGIYAVRDGKGEIFMAPQVYQNKAVALRAFSDAVRNSQSPFNKHPEDYAFFELGTYDEFQGRLESHPQPVHLGNAWDFMSDKPVADLKSVQ